jgi:hypothetical protein
MARYRKIDTRMWADAKFRALSTPQPSGKYLWIALLTGPHTTNLPGLLRVGEMALSEELGWSLEGFREGFAELFREGLAKADWNARVVWIPNAIKFNPPDNPNVVKGWRDAWDEVPECALKTEAYQRFAVFTKGLGEGFAKAFREGCGQGLANQEQEQEQEQEENPMPEQTPSGAEVVPPLNGFDGAIREIWDYFIATLNRSSQTTLTDTRKRMARARLKECFDRARAPQLENAVHVMKLCIDRLSASKWHNGHNPSGKKYLTWEILFRNREQFEKWINDENFCEGAA